MIRFLFRFFGLWILAAAFIFLIYDGTKSIADQASFFITKTSDVWRALHQTSLDQVQPFLTEQVGDWAWTSVAAPILEQPAWLVLGIIGILFILLGRRKKKLIGYTRE